MSQAKYRRQKKADASKSEALPIARCMNQSTSFIRNKANLAVLLTITRSSLFGGKDECSELDRVGYTGSKLWNRKVTERKLVFSSAIRH
ncbi:hypothetical protein PanWU01x14_014060 [Parasponia andersonii]|uniref:Uncharacterized protein n=1 Tax=Parasponia andersonii TaxID=3476 RepID=A0A2P5E160_PARAD|nr:hypothetical protein PanWU01x14_014060 [Parasponia andersonii]